MPGTPFRHTRSGLTVKSMEYPLSVDPGAPFPGPNRVGRFSRFAESKFAEKTQLVQTSWCNSPNVRNTLFGCAGLVAPSLTLAASDLSCIFTSHCHLEDGYDGHTRVVCVSGGLEAHADAWLSRRGYVISIRVH